jgi:hypothetical protein
MDIAGGRRQKMGVMNFVWPITMLWAGPIGLWAYYQMGRAAPADAARGQQHSQHHGQNRLGAQDGGPSWSSTSKGALHCGAGCTLGDLVAESFMAFAVATTLFGWQWSLFGRHIFVAWIVDFVAAFAFGILFQYFAIKPMKNLPPGQAFIAALKADTLSLVAWQVGMYGWMAVATFLIFGHEMAKSNPVFWFMMQIAMLAGFFTSFPVNWWLIKAGVKEAM